MLVYQIMLTPNRAAVATSVSALTPFLQDKSPGRYAVAEITQDLPARGTTRHWGEIIRHEDGSLEFVTAAP